MTVAERTRFLDQAQYGKIDFHTTMMCSVSAERSDCSRESDRQSIHAAIQETVGFDHLNRAIVEVMEKWMLQQFDQHLETQDEEQVHLAKSQMAVMLCDQGRYDEAIVLEEQILAYNRNTHPGGHLNIGVALTNLAISYRQIHRYQDALALHFEALSIYEKKLEPSHPNFFYIGREYGNIGACYHGMKCPADSLRSHQKALQWRRQHLSPDDPAIGMALFSVASAYAIGGEDELAVQWGYDAIQFQKRVLPANHPVLASTLSNLSVALKNCNRHAEAISAIEEAVTLLKRIRAPTHPDLVRVLRIQCSNHEAAARHFAAHS